MKSPIISGILILLGMFSPISHSCSQEPIVHSKSEATKVVFRFRPATKAETVNLAGQFNGWDKGKNPMTKTADGRTWETTLVVEPGVYQYLFVVNGKSWLKDPKVPFAPDGNGNLNSVLVIPPFDFAKNPGKVGDGKITTSAFLHDPKSKDLSRLGPDIFIVRFRTRKNDVEKTSVSYDAGGRESLASPLIKISSDPLYDYWQGTIPSVALKYHFIISDGKTESIYELDGAKTVGDSSKYFSLNAADFPFLQIPNWVQDTIFYQIFPERFENGDPRNDSKGVQPWGTAPTGSNRMGGDLAGVMKRMDYLKVLGVNGIYFNPLFDSASNHGYDTYDYLKVDSRFGTNSELKSLIAKAHKEKMRVILDGVFNHTGVEHRAFKSLREQGAESQYLKWYFTKKFPLEVKDGQNTYEGWFGVPWMPKLNVLNPETKSYLMNVAETWLRDAGADGWRLDAADEIPHLFWKEFRQRVKKTKPDAFILGEIWGDATEWLKGDEFDSVMNYRWRQLVLDYFCYRKMTPARFEEELTRLRESYQPVSQNAMFNLLGSHDTERVTTLFKRDDQRVKSSTANQKEQKTKTSTSQPEVQTSLNQMQAVVFQMTYPGTPCIYYGDEVGLEGGRDPDDRRCMDWTEKSWDRTLQSLYHHTLALRNAHSSLRNGSYSNMSSDVATWKLSNAEAKTIFGFSRENETEKIAVIFNRSSKKIKTQAQFRGVRNGRVKDLVDPGVEIRVDDEVLQIEIPALGYRIIGYDKSQE